MAEVNEVLFFSPLPGISIDENAVKSVLPIIE